MALRVGQAQAGFVAGSTHHRLVLALEATAIAPYHTLVATHHSSGQATHPHCTEETCSDSALGTPASTAGFTQGHATHRDTLDPVSLGLPLEQGLGTPHLG